MAKVFSSVIFCVACSLLFGCRSDGFQEKKIAVDISLVSPEGVRIANSVDELARIPFLLDSNGQSIGKPITITKVVYNWGENEAPHVESAGSQRAAIHSRTSTGEKGVFFIEAGKS